MNPEKEEMISHPNPDIIEYDFIEYVLYEGEWKIIGADETGCPVHIKVSPEELLRGVRIEETSPV